MFILSKYLKRFHNDKRGIGSALIGFVALSFGLTLMFLLVEMGHVYLAKAKIQNDMDFANGSTYAVLDMDKMAYGIYQFHNDGESRLDGYNDALAKYEEKLAENMQLNPGALTPISAKSDVGSPVQIERFEVYLKDDLPLTNSDGYFIDKVAVYSKIKVPIKLYFPLFGDYYYAEASRVTDLEDDL
ncbi:hypothetical protein [Aneurinibacillus tyrosinisolvens]|uniref:hypothetical protein n=1 Tax=Aneurinibacillus tyrosinisolvens TaxID=1443435 RepID=UPI00063F5950|nr:hypothetical protein [Aneurinibacillus tyrosinisolvens]